MQLAALGCMLHDDNLKQFSHGKIDNVLSVWGERHPVPYVGYTHWGIASIFSLCFLSGQDRQE